MACRRHRDSSGASAGHVILGMSSVGTLALESSSSAMLWQRSSNDYLRVDTSTPTIAFGNTTDNPVINFRGSGGIQINGSAGTAGQVLVSGGAGAAPSWGSQTDIVISDNTSPAFGVRESSNYYVRVNTTNNSETLQFGNATTNPTFQFLGSGSVQFAGSSGSSGQVLTSNGASAAPTWQTTASSNPTVITLTDNTANAYIIENTASGPVMFGIDTLNSQERLFSVSNLFELNSDAAAGTAETARFRFRSASAGTEYVHDLVGGTDGIVTLHTETDTGTNVATVLHVGETGITTPVNLSAAIKLNGTSDATTAINAQLAIAWNTTDDRAHLNITGVHQISITNGSSSFIIGDGNHTTTISANTVIVGGASSAQNTSGARTNNTIVGHGSTTNNQSDSTLVGEGGNIGGGKGTGVGSNVSLSSTNGEITGVGYSVSSIADYTTCLGAASGITSASAVSSVAIGYAAQINIANTCLIGGNNANGFITTFVVGRGLTSGTASTLTFRPTNASGNNTGGWSQIFQAGLATGSGADGTLQFQTGNGANSGISTLNGAVERMRILAGTTSGGDIRINGRSNAQYILHGSLTESHTLAAAATSDTTINVPAGCHVIGVSIRITTTITGCTTLDYGVSGDTTRYGTGLALTSGTTNRGHDTATPFRYYGSATAIRFTAVGGGASFTAGVVRVTIYYVQIEPPTS